MNLQQFVKKLPKHLVYAPIYRKGVEIKSREGKILEATGKNPFGESYERQFSPDDVAYVLEKYPDRFGAIGLFTGLKGKGLVPFLRGTALKLYSVLRPVPSLERTKSHASKSE